MLDIKVKTYNEALRLSRCFELYKYVPKITDEMLIEIYNFLAENPQNIVGVSDGIIYYLNAVGEKTNAYTVETITGFDQLLINTAFFKVVNSVSSSDSSGCGGCSCNNNNNNNNNNNG